MHLLRGIFIQYGYIYDFTENDIMHCIYTNLMGDSNLRQTVFPNMSCVFNTSIHAGFHVYFL